MIRILLLWLSLIMTVVYMAWPHSGKVYFPFSDIVLSKRQFAHDFFDHLAIVPVALVLALLEHKYRFPALLFFFICLADVADYTLSYGDPWTGSPITFNSLKVLTFGAIVVYHAGIYIKKRYAGRDH